LFAIAGSLLRRTGAYRQVFQTPQAFPRFRKSTPDAEWWDQARRAGAAWRQALDSKLQHTAGVQDLRALIPAHISAWWKVLEGAASQQLGMFATQSTPVRSRHVGSQRIRPGLDPVRAAICLVIAADEACSGVGLARREEGAEGPESKPFLSALQIVLESEIQDFRTLCLTVLPDLMVVLPKQHTPQTGLTFRSMSHHLALVPAGEIRARWYEQRPKADPSIYNLLLLPWPLEVHSNDFLSTTPLVKGDEAPYHLFDYQPRDHTYEHRVSRWVERAIRQANRIGGPVKVIVMPESALNLREYSQVEKVAARAGVMLIAGVRVSSAESDSGGPNNACMIQTRGLLKTGSVSSAVLALSRFYQSKHHRWCLDRTQILQYGLGNRLPATGKLWENIALPERTLHFICMGPWMTWCALICEDLARQEPAAEVVRAVGSNLVIALLMDGPQLLNRWSARYATGLAEDPGSSVLTFTSLGLLKRSRPLSELNNENFQPNRTIALWRDAFSEPQEIRIGPQDTACILSLACRSEEEFTADGRGDGGEAHHPVYAGHRGFYVKP
jgi:hypothetical protein